MAGTGNAAQDKARKPWAGEGDHGDRVIYQGFAAPETGMSSVIRSSSERPHDQDEKAH